MNGNNRLKVIEIIQRKCSPKIQPNIQAGKRYLLQGFDKTKEGVEVVVLIDWEGSRAAKKLKTMRCNARRFEWRIISEEVLREEQIRNEARKTTNELLHKFSFEEHMQIAFVPLIIIHCAWIYADKVLAECAEKRIETTKKLGRAVKMLRKEYIEEMSKDLDFRHRKQVEDQCSLFMQSCARDFTIMEMTLGSEILKSCPDDPYNQMRTYAFIAMLLCDYCKQQQEECDRLIAQRTGQPKTPTILNPKIDALRTCMDAYTGTVKIDMEHNVALCVRVFANNLKRVNFSIAHEMRVAHG